MGREHTVQCTGDVIALCPGTYLLKKICHAKKQQEQKDMIKFRTSSVPPCAKGDAQRGSRARDGSHRLAGSRARDSASSDSASGGRGSSGGALGTCDSPEAASEPSAKEPRGGRRTPGPALPAPSAKIPNEASAHPQRARISHHDKVDSSLGTERGSASEFSIR